MAVRQVSDGGVLRSVGSRALSRQRFDRVRGQVRFALELVRPSSIAFSGTSASIVGLGSVDFSAVTSLSLNGVFSAGYDNYMVVLRGADTANSNVAIRMRGSNTDATGTNYVYQQLFGNSTTVSGQRLTAQSSAWTGYLSSSQRSGNTVYIYGPNLAQPTAGRVVNVAGLNNAAIVDYAWTHSLSTAYDGFTFLGLTSMSGSVAVYGLRG